MKFLFIAGIVFWVMLWLTVGLLLMKWKKLSEQVRLLTASYREETSSGNQSDTTSATGGGE